MNKTLIAIAVAAAAMTVAGTANAAQIYSNNNTTLNLGGYIQAQAQMNHDSKVDNTSDASEVRLHLSGKTQINDDLYGIGYFSYNVGDFDSDGDGNYTRQAYAGIGSNTWGQITYGKQYGALNNISNFTDVMPVFGGYANNLLPSNNRINNNIAYQGTFGGLNVYANYRLNPGSATTTDVGDFANHQYVKNGYGLAGTYTFSNGFAFGMGYSGQNNANAFAGNTTNPTGKHSANYQFGASYTTENLYLAGLYTTGKMDTAQNSNSGYQVFNPGFGMQGVHDFQGYELVAQYYVMPKLQVGAAYNYGAFDGASKSHVQYANLLDLNVNYNLTTNFQAYLSYNINFLNDYSAKVSGISQENTVGVGATYNF